MIVAAKGWERGKGAAGLGFMGWGAWAWALGRLPPSWPTRGQPLGCSSLGRRPRFQHFPQKTCIFQLIPSPD